MLFRKIAPKEELAEIVKEFWVYESEDTQPHIQKIIPDGFSEIILHYGDPYRIKLDNEWKLQAPSLFSSQISRYFYLENTGRSGIIGIKLHPISYFELFQKDVSPYTDKVIPLSEVMELEILESLKIQTSDAIEKRIQSIEQWLLDQTDNRVKSSIREVVDFILDKKGMVAMEELIAIAQVSERQLERSFKKAIGLTSKFYSRIIRFNYIFEVMKEQNNTWVKTALQTGYFDQSHFIKNFKEFTGEEPSQYGFDELNLANFFLKK